MMQRHLSKHKHHSHSGALFHLGRQHLMTTMHHSLQKSRSNTTRPPSSMGMARVRVLGPRRLHLEETHALVVHKQPHQHHQKELQLEGHKQHLHGTRCPKVYQNAIAMTEIIRAKRTTGPRVKERNLRRSLHRNLNHNQVHQTRVILCLELIFIQGI